MAILKLKRAKNVNPSTDLQSINLQPGEPIIVSKTNDTHTIVIGSDSDNILFEQNNNSPINVVQTTGTSTTDVMSQKAVTDAISSAGGGDMLKSIYDTNNDGKVDNANNADSTPFSGITSKPTTLSGYGITDATPLSHVGSTGISQHGLGNGTNPGFSTNDYTTTEKDKLTNIQSGAEVNVQSDWNQSNTTADDYIKNKPSLATVATSGSYNDLSNKPSIPTPLTVVQDTGTSTTDIMSQKAVTDAITSAGGGDMLKSIYDTNNDGKVNASDEATKLSTPRTISLSGGATGTSPTFDGTSNITIPITSLNATVLSGTASIDTTGNAGTAHSLSTPRTITIDGDVSGSTVFDGSGDVTITTTIDSAGTTVIQDIVYDMGPTIINNNSPVRLSCKLATTGNINLNGNQMIDGFSSDSNIKILVKNQNDPIENGLYISNYFGNWSRSDDFAFDTQIDYNILVNISHGNTQANTYWSSVAPREVYSSPILSIGYDEINFYQIGDMTKSVYDTNNDGRVNASDEATKLSTNKFIITNLGSNSSQGFDGTIDISPGVTGVLNVQNGGTGVSTISGLIKGNGTSSFSVAQDGTDYISNTYLTSIKGVANGVATLDSGGKVPLSQISDVLLGQVLYGGVCEMYNEYGTAQLSTNACTKLGLPDGSNIDLYGNDSNNIKLNEGIYYIVREVYENPGLGGYDYQVGDWAISTGTEWIQVKNTDNVTMVNGMIGEVSIYKNEVGLGNVDNLKQAPFTHVGSSGISQHGLGNGTNAGFSTNDYTTTEKTKLSGIATGAQVNVQSDWNQGTTSSADYIKNKPNLATVATTGSYNDLTNLPTFTYKTFTPSSFNSNNGQIILNGVNTITFNSRNNIVLCNLLSSFTANSFTNGTTVVLTYSDSQLIGNSQSITSVGVVENDATLLNFNVDCNLNPKTGLITVRITNNRGSTVSGTIFLIVGFQYFQ